MEKFLGKYRIATPLVTKASNPVYLARSMTSSQWNSVVKLFTSIHLETPQEQDNFVQKIRMFMKYQHRSLLPMLDVGIEQEHPYIVSKYASRGSLRRHLDQHAPLDIAEGMQIVSQIGQALQYIHEQHLFHGNIKPENVLFDEHTTVALLADPALSCILEETYSPSNAHTIYYPQAELASQQSDQYALGCMAYELFTGQMLPAAIPLATTQELPCIENGPSNILPEHIETVLYKAMASDPAERYKSVAAFIDALDDAALSAATVPVSSSGIIVSSLTNSMEVVSGYSLAIGTPYQRKSPTVTKRTVGVLLCLLIAVFASSLYFLQALPGKPVRHAILIEARPTVAVTTAVVITATAVVPTPTQPVTIAHKVPIATQVPMPTPTLTPQPSPSPQPTAVSSPPPQPTAAPMVPTPAPLPIQVQVKNAGFEAGNLSGWACSFGTSVITNFVFSGTHALQLSANLLGGSQCTQTIAVQPNHTYTLRAYVKGNSASLGVQGGPGISVSSANYALQSVQFTTGGSTTSVTIYIANNRGGLFGSNVYADNFSVQ